MGYEFTIMSADIDERRIRKEKPQELVMTLAEAKADALISKLQACHNEEMDVKRLKPTILIAADTVRSGKNHQARKKQDNSSKVILAGMRKP